MDAVYRFNRSCSVILTTLWSAALLASAVAGRARPDVTDYEQLKRLSIEDLMELPITSVSRSPMQLSEAPSAVQLITNEQIRRSGATSIPQALRLATNLNVAQKTANAWGISARGFNTELANKLLVMIDGRTIYTPLFSGVRWDVQDYLLEDIERIEVISGPGGSVWGANAVNGTINITSKAAQATQGLFVEAGAGDQLEQMQSVRYGGQLAPQVFFRVYGKHTDRDDERFAAGGAAGDHSSFSQGGFRLDADTRTIGTFTLQGDYYRGHEGLPLAGDAKVAGGNVMGRWVHTLATGSDVQLQMYYDRTFLRQPFATNLFGPAGTFRENLHTGDIDFQYRFVAAERHELMWGLGYRYIESQTEDAPTLGFNPPVLEQALYSAFVQDQIRLSESTVATLGTKLEHTDYTGVEVEPTARIQHTLGDDQMVWAAISRAVRTPSRIDRDLRQPSRGTTILAGGGEFDSETVIAYEAGWRGQYGRDLAGAVALFYNEYESIRSLRSTPNTFLPLYFANDVEGSTHGVELTASYDALDRARFYAGYTWLKADLRVRRGGMDLNNALNETSDPEHQASLGTSIDLPGGVELDTHLRWVDTLRNNNNGQVATVPSYVDLNVRLGLNLTEHLEAAVVGQNLLDAHHPEFGLTSPNRVEIRRSIFAKLTWRY